MLNERRGFGRNILLPSRRWCCRPRLSFHTDCNKERVLCLPYAYNASPPYKARLDFAVPTRSIPGIMAAIPWKREGTALVLNRKDDFNVVMWWVFQRYQLLQPKFSFSDLLLGHRGSLLVTEPS